MLSERLRERNFAREQLEGRLEEVEGRLNSQRRALAAIPRHLTALRDHLTPLLPDKVTLDLLSPINAIVEGGSPEQVMEEGFGAVVAALREVAKDKRKVMGEGGGKVHAHVCVEGEMLVRVRAPVQHSYVLCVHAQLQEEEEEEVKEGVVLPAVASQAVSELEDEVRALQSRCEEAERALADAR